MADTPIGGSEERRGVEIVPHTLRVDLRPLEERLWPIGSDGVADSMRSGQSRDFERGPAYAQLRSVLLNGSVRIRFPVAAKIALHTAGARGGNAGSPRPVVG